MDYIILPEEDQPALPPGRDRSLVIEYVTLRGTGSVFLRPYVRVAAETKRGYRRLIAYISLKGTRTELCLATAAKRNFDNVIRKLEDLAKTMLRYESLDDSSEPDEERIARLVESFPIEQWLWVMMRGYAGGSCYFEGLGEKVIDDGRNCMLKPMEQGKTQRLELWPGLRVLLEDLGPFRRLSLYHYQSKRKSTTRVLSTSDKPDIERARAITSRMIVAYRKGGREFPVELERRLPVEQWIAMLTHGLDAESLTSESLGSNRILTIRPAKGKSAEDCLARWTLSPSVVLSFQERADRPALYIHERLSPDKPKLSNQRISSIPIVEFENILGIITDAIERNLENPDLDLGGLGTPLIDPAAVFEDGELAYDRLDKAIEALPLAQMLGFYDQAVLPMRLNGHRQHIYPDYDYDMRWIAKAGPETHTATQDCWWVLVGTIGCTRKGSVFPFNGDASAALAEAKAWRDEEERKMGVGR